MNRPGNGDGPGLGWAIIGMPLMALSGCWALASVIFLLLTLPGRQRVTLVIQQSDSIYARSEE